MKDIFFFIYTSEKRIPLAFSKSIFHAKIQLELSGRILDIIFVLSLNKEGEDVTRSKVRLK